MMSFHCVGYSNALLFYLMKDGLPCKVIWWHGSLVNVLS